MNQRNVIAVVVLVLALGAVTWLGFRVYSELAPPPPRVLQWKPEDQRAVLAIKLRRRVPQAQVPWFWSVNQPEDARVDPAGQPWLTDVAHPAPQILYPAKLPEFPLRQAVDEPISTDRLTLSAIPWHAQSPGDHTARIEEAYLPTLRRKLDLNKPEPVIATEAAVPWRQSASSPEPVQLPRAHVPQIAPQVIPPQTRPETPTTQPAPVVTPPPPATTQPVTRPASPPTTPPSTRPAGT